MVLNHGFGVIGLSPNFFFGKVILFENNDKQSYLISLRISPLYDNL